jgi:hypothetical protein
MFADDDQPMVMLGFGSMDDLIHFINWVNNTFDDPEELKAYFEDQYGHGYDSDNDCTRSAADSKAPNDFEFWDIVKNSFKNHHEESNDDLHNTD